MTAISIADLNNAKTDVDHISAIANSTATTATDRQGNTKYTMKGVIQSLAALNPRGAWATGTVYAQKDLVTVSSVWYICINGHTSAAAFATDMAANWRVYQDATDDQIGKVVTCYGDSFTMGVSGGISYAQAYISLIAAAKGWSIPTPPDFGSPGKGSTTVGNQAYGGSQIASTEQIERIMAHSVADDDLQFILTGINDSRNLGTAGAESYRQALMAALAWMSLPASHPERFFANSADTSRLTRTGTGWTANTTWFNGNGYHTAVAGDSLNFTVFGDTVYIALPRDTTTTGKCDIKVDGTVIAQYDFSGAYGAAQYSVTRTMGFVRISGLGRGMHGINVIKTSAATGTDFMRVDWVAGVNGNVGSHNVRGGPQVFVGNCCRLTDSSYTLDGPTWNKANNAVVDAYNALIKNCVIELAEDGANISYVDASLHYNPNSSDLSADTIHPSATGHQKIAAAFLEKMDEHRIHAGERNSGFAQGKKRPTNSSLGQIMCFGEERLTTLLGGGGKQTILSYNIKVVNGAFYRIDESLGATQITIGPTVDSAMFVYAAPGSGPITAWTTIAPFVQTETAVTPTLTNSWIQNATWSTFGVKKFSTPSGGSRVVLAGTISGGTIPAAAFTLPVGYRPSRKFAFPVASNGLFGYVTVNTDGTVVVEAGSTLWVALDGCSFII